MFKFFRKIRQKLIEEEKLKKYLIYAIGEIILVMIGILLALQVNNWNEINKNKSEEQKILKSIKTELEDNIIKLEETLQSLSLTKKNLKILLNKYNIEKQYELGESDLFLFRNSVLGKTYNPQFGVLNSLLNSEKINQIEDGILRNRLAIIPGMLDEFREDEQVAVNSVINYYLPEVFNLSPVAEKQSVHKIVNFWNFLIVTMEVLNDEGKSLILKMKKDIEIVNTKIK